MNLVEFLSAFYPDTNETICIRAFKPKDAPDTASSKPANLETTIANLERRDGVKHLTRLNDTRGVYFAPNAGGHKDADIHRPNAVFIEKDDMPIADQHANLDNGPLKTSIRVETKRSVHAYWLLNNCTVDQWREIQLRLIHYFSGDPANKNPSRLMRLPGFMHLTYSPAIKGRYEKKLVEVTEFDSKVRYSASQLLAAFPPVQRIRNPSPEAGLPSGERIIGNGHRNQKLFSMAGGLRRQGFGEDELLASLNAVNAVRVRPPLAQSEIAEIVRNIMRYPSVQTDDVSKQLREPNIDFVIPDLPETALYGLAGEIVQTIEPHTEADRAALLVQLLTAFGCMIGMSAHFLAEADKHYTKFFAVMVGASSKGRKGSSWGHVRRILCRVDETFIDCIQDGLSSGEGLIYHVRDSLSKITSVKKKGRIVDYQDEVVDKGAAEKRLLVVEPEFARVLKVMQREGNTLSSLIRQAWDSDRLRVMTKSPLRATESHISIIGHITTPELRRNLADTDLANGFANRFIWVFTRRSKELPFGGKLRDADLNSHVMRLRESLAFGRSAGEIRRDVDADELWRSVYSRLSNGPLDLVGTITSRAEAQVMRIACVLAVLDLTNSITPRHLNAALALWQYSEDSVRYIFGQQTGDKTADSIFEALKAAPEGLTATQLRDLFNRNATANQIATALRMLADLGRIRERSIPTEGRPARQYYVVGTT